MSNLVKMHNELDKAVDLAYRPNPFISEANRMEFLFVLYEKYTADLFTKEKKKRGKSTQITQILYSLKSDINHFLTSPPQ
jgi:hypothetical protein